MCQQDTLSKWFLAARLDEMCSHNTRCPDCRPDGSCESCDSIEGRWIDAVAEYASTCDECAALTSHIAMRMDPETQFGYCEECFPKLPPEIQDRILAHEAKEKL